MNLSYRLRKELFFIPGEESGTLFAYRGAAQKGGFPMVELFYKGGPLMYPLLLGSILMIAVVIERGIHFIGTGVNRKFIESIKSLIGQHEFDAALKISEESRGPVPEVICELLRFRRYTQDVVENEISIRGDQILRGLSKNLHLLELIGKIAPMIGLLGTVMGMVEAFQKVAVVKDMVNPSVLASGIWEALITTVGGLFVGIPALVFHHLYQNKLKSIAFSMKHYAEEIYSMTKGVQ
jgi:biopolymer transport protein ExbB